MKAIEQYFHVAPFIMLYKVCDHSNKSFSCTCAVSGLGYMKDYPYERVMRDSRILLIFEVSDYQKINNSLFTYVPLRYLIS